MAVARNLDENQVTTTRCLFREKTRTTCCQCATGPICEKGDPRPTNTFRCPRRRSQRQGPFCIHPIRGLVRISQEYSAAMRRKGKQSGLFRSSKIYTVCEFWFRIQARACVRTEKNSGSAGSQKTCAIDTCHQMCLMQCPSPQAQLGQQTVDRRDH